MSVFDQPRKRKFKNIATRSYQIPTTCISCHVYVEGRKEGGLYYTNTQISSNCSFLLFNDYKTYTFTLHSHRSTNKFPWN